MKYIINIYNQGLVVSTNINVNGYKWEEMCEKYETLVNSYLDKGYVNVDTKRAGEFGCDVLAHYDNSTSIMLSYKFYCIIDEFVDADGINIVRDVVYKSDDDNYCYKFKIDNLFRESGVDNLILERVVVDSYGVAMGGDIFRPHFSQEFIDVMKLHRI